MLVDHLFRAADPAPLSQGGQAPTSPSEQEVAYYRSQRSRSIASLVNRLGLGGPGHDGEIDAETKCKTARSACDQ